MAKQTINVGTTPNDGTGDTLKASFTKCNDNFTELYNADAAANVKTGFSAHKNGTTQSYTGSTFTKVTFPTEIYDNGGYYDASLSRWTPPSGVVHMDAGIRCTAGGGGSFIYLYIYKNGVSFKVLSIPSLAAGDSGGQLSLDDVASGTDYYEVYLWLTNASTIDGSSQSVFFMGHLTGGPKGDTGASGAATGEILSSNAGRLICVSTTQLKFIPFNGDRVRINGTWHHIPASGVVAGPATSVYLNGVAAQTLATSTLYYIYLFNDAGTLKIDFSTTGHTTSSTGSNEGTEIKYGDDTRTLIGLMRTMATVEFSDIPTHRLVISWFNRRMIHGHAVLASNTSIGSAPWANLGFYIYFLTWGEGVMYATTFTVSNTGSAYGYGRSAIDNLFSTDELSGTATYVLLYTNESKSMTSEGASQPAEGYHWISAGGGWVTGGPAVLYASGGYTSSWLIMMG